jgi:hypothetical protein
MLMPYIIYHIKATINGFATSPLLYLLHVQFPRYTQNNKYGIGEYIYDNYFISNIALVA